MGAERVDVIVVGGGTAGCSFVSYLSEVSDASVSLFEAGPSVASHPSNLFASMARSGVMDTSLGATANEKGDSYEYLQAQVLGLVLGTSRTVVRKSRHTDFPDRGINP
jgi:choline dehydrogenase-like flavoprotein